MDGIAATEEIRSNEKIYNTKQIISNTTTTTTTTIDTSDEDEFVRVGERKRSRPRSFSVDDGKNRASPHHNNNHNNTTTTVVVCESRRKKRIPIIALTANCFEEGRQRCLKAGMDDFLVKVQTSDVLVSQFS